MHRKRAPRKKSNFHLIFTRNPRNFLNIRPTPQAHVHYRTHEQNIIETRERKTRGQI